MSSMESGQSRPPSQKPVLTLAWVVTLAVSLLPDVLWQMFAGHTPVWVFPAKLALLAGLMVAGFFWRAARPLLVYCLMLLVLFLADLLRGRLEASALWQQWFGPGFTNHMLSSQVLRVGVAGVMIAVLLLLRYRPRDFFLVKGDLNATVAPVRWLGIDKPMGWRRLGLISALCISGGTMVFLVIGGRPSLGSVAKALPFLPMVLVLAAMNAFAEEVSFRGALLAPLCNGVSQFQAVLLTGAFFGIGHYYGVPYGIIGVIMASLLGWYLGKCMVETKGFVWPWLIHFLQDVLVFSFMAIGAIVAGGK